MPDCYDISENKLVEKINDGDSEAFENLFLKFYSSLCKFAWRYVHSSHIAEELVQEIFLDVWKNRKSLDSSENIKAYLYKSVKNKALNHLKHKSLAEEYNQEIEWVNRTPITQIHSFSDNSEFVRQTKKEIEDLPEGARNIYKLSRKDGLTYREISEVLDISIKTVESQMSRALKILRQNLSIYLSKKSRASSHK